MKSTYIKLLSAFALSVFFAACGHQHNDHAHDHNGEDTTHTHNGNGAQGTHAHEENVVTLSQKQVEMAGISTGYLEMKNLTSYINVNGKLAVPNQNKALVTSLTGGVLKSLNVQPGDNVRKGQVIGTIVNTEATGLQQEMVRVSENLKFAEQEVARQQELVQGNAAPMKNLQKAEAELRSLKAQKQGLQQQLSAYGIHTTGISSSLPVVAPISGAISDINAQIGSRIDANMPIAGIINNSELHLDLYVYEKDLPKVSKGQNIHFTLTNVPGKEYDAVIYSIGKAFADETKAVPVHAHVVNNKAGLIEGMSVTALISLGEDEYPAVPDEAIVTNEGKEYIFVQEGAQDSTENISYKRVQVFKGASEVGYSEIQTVEPLPEHARIVISGAFFLMATITNHGEAHEH